MTFPGKAKIRPATTSRLLPYQTKWVEDPARLKIAEKSRQIGWTWATAYGVVRRQALKGARLDCWISSRDKEQAILFCEDIKTFSHILKAGADDLGEHVLDDKGSTAQVIRFASGTRAISLSSNPDAQAGKRGHRVLDEFALHADPQHLYSIAKPGVTWGGRMEIFSTHRGSANYFNTLIQEIKHKGNPKKFSLHTVTLQDALDQGFLYVLQRKIAEIDPTDDRLAMDEAAYFDAVRSEMPTEEDFLQEYMCIPSDDNSAFLAYDLITACQYRPDEIWETDLDDVKNPMYVGVDVGRDHDLTVIYVVEKFGGLSFTRRMIELQNTKFSEQERILWDILQLPQVRRCCIDQTGIGRQFAERAQDRFGYKVEGITFTGQSKEELAYPLRAAFEDRIIRIPAGEKLRADLRAIKKVTTSSGNVRFAADRGKNGHADRFWAAALAQHAAQDAGVPFMPVAVARRPLSRRQTQRAVQ